MLLLSCVSSAKQGSIAALSSQDKLWKQYEHHVREPLIYASRLLERGHKVVLDEKPRIQCKSGDTLPLERTCSLFAVRLWIPKGFHRQG